MNRIFFNRATKYFLLFGTGILGLSFAANAQQNKTNKYPVPENIPDTGKVAFPLPGLADSTKNVGQYLTLKQCLDYAMVHQPALNKSVLNTDIVRRTNAISLSTLLPQVSASGNIQHYLQSPNNNVNGTTSNSTIANSFVPQLAVSQAILNPSLLYAIKAAPLYVKQSEQATDSTKINLVSTVSKSFYNVLLTLEQISVLKEDTARLGKNVRDTYHQYKGGIVDETDYEEATITLNNSKAQLKQATENVVPQYAALKQLIGFEPAKDFNVSIDTAQMMADIHIDTTKQLQYEKRIEYQELQTQKSLQFETTNYYRHAFLPTVSAFFNYNLAFYNSNLPSIFNNSYPSSVVGLSLSVPIFTGFARINNVRKSQLQERVLGWDEVDLKLELNKEYRSALAGYKSNLYNFNLLQRNVSLAKRVYFVVNLQYKQGIVAYLNVITAESNLISAEISYANALFQVLSSKIDLEKAMGAITY